MIYNFEEWGTYSCCCKKWCKSFGEEDENSKRKNKQWFEKKYCDDHFRDAVSAYYKKHIIKPEDGCETKDEETGDAGTQTDPESNKKEACCTTC